MSIRLGLMVRSDNRGLGRQTFDYFKHLKPAKTLHVRMTSPIGSWTPYMEHDWYPGARSVDFNGFTGTLDDDALRWILTDVDVFLTAETAYDHRAWDWARAAGVRTVLVGNPEFLGPDKLTGPDLIVAPSTWKLAEFPGVVHLPQPVDRETFTFTRRPLSSPPRFLHLVGNRATRDRAGTDIILDCIRYLRNRVDLTIRMQGPLSAPQDLRLRSLPRLKIPAIVRADVDDPRELYRDYDVLVAPRRYGGLSLPLNEATSCGLAILAGRREPEARFLPSEALLPVSAGREARFQGGTFRLEDVAPLALAGAMDRLHENPEAVARLSDASDRYAESIAWTTLLPRWRSLLERVPGLVTVP